MLPMERGSTDLRYLIAARQGFEETRRVQGEGGDIDRRIQGLQNSKACAIRRDKGPLPDFS